MSRPRFSRQRYKQFLEDYKLRRLDDSTDGTGGQASAGDGRAGDEKEARPEKKRPDRGKRREYLRQYLRWLRPHRYALAAVFLLALLVAGFEMIEPLFMRFIIDRVLLNKALDTASRFARL